MKKPMSTTSLFDILSDVRGTKLTKIAQIDRVIDWAPVRAVIETVYTTGSAPMGRPSFDGIMLFKIELLRVWYGLRDEGAEEMANDRISSSRFVGLAKTHAQHVMEAIAHNLYRAPELIVANA